jgi:hypothetical protein
MCAFWLLSKTLSGLEICLDIIWWELNTLISSSREPAVGAGDKERQGNSFSTWVEKVWRWEIIIFFLDCVTRALGKRKRHQLCGCLEESRKPSKPQCPWLWEMPCSDWRSLFLLRGQPGLRWCETHIFTFEASVFWGKNSPFIQATDRAHRVSLSTEKVMPLYWACVCMCWRVGGGAEKRGLGLPKLQKEHLWL